MRLPRTLLFCASIVLALSTAGYAQSTRKERMAILQNEPPKATLAASVTTIMLPCEVTRISLSGVCPSSVSTSVALTTAASDPDADALVYSYTVNAGRITGQGAKVSWDLSGIGPGTYTAAVKVDDSFGGITSAATTVTITNCRDCVIADVCPTISSSCPDAVDQGQLVVFTATVGQGLQSVTNYKWIVSAGTIASGQGTNTITVNTDNLGGQDVTATFEVEGIDPACPRTASCTTPIRPLVPHWRKFDEYGSIRFNDEKARLDNFAIQLQNERTFQGYVIAYGRCGDEGRARGHRAKDYLVNNRGVASGRVVVIDGGCMPALLVELWMFPRGVTPPTADPTGEISPCPDCGKKPARRRSGEK